MLGWLLTCNCDIPSRLSFVIISGPIGLVNLLTAKACGAKNVAVTGKNALGASWCFIYQKIVKGRGVGGGGGRGEQGGGSE